MKTETHTHERFEAAIRRMRLSKAERDRVLGIVELKHVEALRADLRAETISGSRRQSPGYTRAVCTAFYVASESEVRMRLQSAIVAEPASQKPLDAMLGRYEAYRPVGGGRFEKYPFEISQAEGSYIVSDDSTAPDGNETFHDGFAFLVQDRVHVIEPARSGPRSMIFRFEANPEDNPVRGIVLDAAAAQPTERVSAQNSICATNFIAFHQSNKRYFAKQVANAHLTVLLSPGRVGPGVIRA